MPLHPPKAGQAGAKYTGADWTVNFDELRAAITPKTKIIILNTPHNPGSSPRSCPGSCNLCDRSFDLTSTGSIPLPAVGKVFSRAELEQFAEVAIKNNILVLADEVVSRLFSSLASFLALDAD